MPESYASDRLTSEDAVFLYLENDAMPLHIGSVSVFDGPIPFPKCVRFIESRLPLIPRYRQRIVTPPFNFGHPTWEADPAFDIENHVHHARLKKGTAEELEEFAGEKFSQIMDRTKPLWDITMIDGLRGRRSAMLCRVHHCLVDGVSGVGLLNVLLDAMPQTGTFPKPKKVQSRPLPGPAASLIDAVATTYSEMLDRVLSAQAAALNIAQALLADSAAVGLQQLLRLVPELLTPVERLPFNQPVLGPRKVAWTEIAIPEVSAVREACGGTLNDVMLTVVTLAVARYAALHGEKLKGRLLRVMVPVNVRREGIDNGLGNRVSMLPVGIPLDIQDPAALLAAVHERTEALKRARVADLVHLAATWMGTTPAPLQALLGPLASLLPVPPFHMVCTNVPGPQLPLYMLGRRMLTYYPYVPIGNEMAVNCAIQSYDHKLYLGLTADAKAAGDVSRLRTFLDEAFADLCKLSGLSRKHRKEPAPARKTVRRKAKPKVAPAPGAENAEIRAETPVIEAAPPVPPVPEPIPAGVESTLEPELVAAGD